MKDIDMKQMIALAFLFQLASIAQGQPLCDFMGKDALYVETVGDTIQVWDLAACAYCSATFAMSVTVSADTIHIVQTDTAGWRATCGCIFDLRTSIVGLVPGTYWVVVTRDLLKKYKYPIDRHQFIGAIQFNYQPTNRQSFQWSKYQSGCIISSVTKENQLAVDRFDLLPNYPNPFNPSTTIQFSISKREYVEVKVFDAIGREVQTLLSAETLPGIHTLRFSLGDGGSSGVYYCRMVAGGFSQTRMMVLQR
jgi:hypothetical protein